MIYVYMYVYRELTTPQASHHMVELFITHYGYEAFNPNINKSEKFININNVRNL